MTPDALLREALERLADRADEYRQAVAEANRYLNEDLPSAKALVFALGSARAALRRLVDEYDEDMGRPPSFTSMDEARAALAATLPASAERDALPTTRGCSPGECVLRIPLHADGTAAEARDE